MQTTDGRIGANYCEVDLDAETENDGTKDVVTIEHTGGAAVELSRPAIPGEHCPSVLAGGCTAHVDGEMTLRVHFFGVEAQEARCHVELDVRLDEDGDSRIEEFALTNGAHGETNCPTVSPACTSSLPWAGGMEETAASTITWTSNVCIDPSEFLDCSGNLLLNLVESGGEHHINETDNRVGASFCELDLTGETENDGTQDDITMTHL